MDDLRERIAYLQGLAEGLKLEEGKDEARIIKQMIDILADLIDKVEEVQATQEDMNDYLESIDEDLYEDDDDDEDDEDDDEDDDECCECEECGHGNDDASTEELNYVEVECNNCHDIICFEEDILDDDDIVEITCPNCNQVVFVNDGSMPKPESSGKAKKCCDKSKPETEDI